MLAEVKLDMGLYGKATVAPERARGDSNLQAEQLINELFNQNPLTISGYDKNREFSFATLM